VLWVTQPSGAWSYRRLLWPRTLQYSSLQSQTPRMKRMAEWKRLWWSKGRCVSTVTLTTQYTHHMLQLVYLTFISNQFQRWTCILICFDGKLFLSLLSEGSLPQIITFSPTSVSMVLFAQIGRWAMIVFRQCWKTSANSQEPKSNRQPIHSDEVVPSTASCMLRLANSGP